MAKLFSSAGRKTYFLASLALTGAMAVIGALGKVAPHMPEEHAKQNTTAGEITPASTHTPAHLDEKIIREDLSYSPNLRIFFHDHPDFGKTEQERAELVALVKRYPLPILTALTSIRDDNTRALAAALANDTETILRALEVEKNERDDDTNRRKYNSADNRDLWPLLEKHPDKDRIYDALFDTPFGYYGSREALEKGRAIEAMPYPIEKKVTLVNKMLASAHYPVRIQALTAKESRLWDFSDPRFEEGLRAYYSNTPGEALYSTSLLREQGVPDSNIQIYTSIGFKTIAQGLNDTAWSTSKKRNEALPLVRLINEAHELDDVARFTPTSYMSAKALLTLIHHGREEVFTSTYLGLAKQLLAQMDKNNLKMEAFTTTPQDNEILQSVFALASEYGQSKSLLDRFGSEGAKQSFLESFLNSFDTTLEAERNAPRQTQSVVRLMALADFIGSIEDVAQRDTMENSIAAKYKKATDPLIKSAYGFLISAYLDKHPGRQENEAFHALDAQQKYPLPDTSVTSGDKLFTNGTCTIRLAFYDDDDGKKSFANFLGSCKANKWTVTDKGGFVILKKSNNGRTVQMIANKHDANDEALGALTDYMEQNKLEPNVVVHRGHSYHAKDTIKQLKNTTALFIDLGCGGYRRMCDALENAPHALLVSTRQVGTMFVNDPLLQGLAQTALNDGEIRWGTFWPSIMNKITDVRKAHYTAPHENKGLYTAQALKAAASAEPVPLTPQTAANPRASAPANTF